ncbi:Hypothetical protein NTJ_15051 [Nesidiocoris tenuis]|uniref:Enoyl-CoA hydratase n=1 Tax=Nesidiocoris tenuis TaxID=355587 RepID=A0ABN7BD32_9HEMI|nr:Hypothetical protein NTJ_15051 [Nesidiocoris tenuis]
MSPSQSVLRSDSLSGPDKGILVVNMSRHEGRNSLSKELVECLEDVFDTAKKDESLRTIILKSDVPKVFCAGADLKERMKMSENEVRTFVNRLRNLMMKIEETPVPVIAAINGAALGGGLEMALACDIRVASEMSKIGLVETRLAIIPGAGGTQRLTRIVGLAVAKELIFTSRVLNGKEAAAYGIVNHCVPADADGNDTAYSKALEIAREILPNGPLGVRMAKIAVGKSVEVDIATGLTMEELCYSRVVSSKDRIEGLRAFQEKRTPKYSGE